MMLRTDDDNLPLWFCGSHLSARDGSENFGSNGSHRLEMVVDGEQVGESSLRLTGE
jgi:uncharacterized protein YndB with AHSA1/START domain